VLKGSFHGLLKGLLAFVILCGLALAVVTVGGAIWIVFALIMEPSIRPS
jgi:hypothetical protein